MIKTYKINKIIFINNYKKSQKIILILLMININKYFKVQGNNKRKKNKI